jgi:hypothetical protein
MKIKYLIYIICFISLLYINTSAQFDKPVIQFGIGISEPLKDLKGNYYSYQMYSSPYINTIQILTVDSNFAATNFGAKTGIHIFGTGKINFDKYNILRGIITASFNSFNTFERTKRGYGVVRAIFINGDTADIPTPIEYNYTFNSFSLGIGIETAPLSFTNLLSPYFGAAFNFNFLSATISRTENNIDSSTIDFSDLRLGISLNAGLEVKINKTIGISLGVKYDIANLLLKNNAGSIADRLEWGKRNAAIIDEEGLYFSNLSQVFGTPFKQYQAKTKQFHWISFYIAANIYLDFFKQKTKKSTDKK